MVKLDRNNLHQLGLCSDACLHNSYAIVINLTSIAFRLSQSQLHAKEHKCYRIKNNCYAATPGIASNYQRNKAAATLNKTLVHCKNQSQLPLTIQPDQGSTQPAALFS